MDDGWVSSVAEEDGLTGHERYLWPFLALFALDGFLTALGTSAGWVKEVNPVLAWLSPLGILLLKVSILPGLWLAGRWVWLQSPKLAQRSLLSLTLIMGMVTGWVLVVILHELAWLQWGIKILG